MDLDTWAPADRLAGWVDDATASLLGVIGDFDDDDSRWMVPYQDIINPPIWEIAHAAWFAEWFVLRRLHNREPLLAGVDARYDSGAVPHITRWQIDYPDSATTRAYVRAVGEAVHEVVRNDRGLDSTAPFALYAVAHHDAHTEALTYTRQTLGWSPPPDLVTGGEPAATGTEPMTGDRAVDGGRLLLGASRAQPFVMDNERWAHPVEVAPFAMATTPVTTAEFLAFVEDGGYEMDTVWSAGGRSWRDEAVATAPAYWRRGDDGWEQRTFDSWGPVVSRAEYPMMHVNWWEADAWCRWAQRRLPTEAEWEFAATTAADGTKRWWYPWGDRDPESGEAALDATAGGTVPVAAHAPGDGPWGHRQLIGNVWEWTATTFEPYPHFEPDAYRDNSEPWFGTRKVLRGGSWATRSRYVRSTFRNFFTRDRRDVFAGFRTCPR